MRQYVLFIILIYLLSIYYLFIKLSRFFLVTFSCFMGCCGDVDGVVGGSGELGGDVLVNWFVR